MFIRMTHPSRFLFLILVILFLDPALARSADLQVLSRNSEVILLGKTLGTRCQWAETSMNIQTYTTFQVERCIKGGLRPGGTVIIKTSGGSIHGIRQRVPRAPSFQNGEYALVFLNPGRKGVYLVYGDKEGMIPIVGKGKKRATHDGKGLSHLIRDVNLVLAR